MLAANTSFADFPRLSSLLARDRFLPRQFANRGDRLVFSNGIVLLAVFLSDFGLGFFAVILSRLIPVRSGRVFPSFTLSQPGMIVHWWKEGQSLKAMRAAATADDLQAKVREVAASGSFDLNVTGRLEPRQIAKLGGERKSLAEVARLEKGSHWKKSLVINGIGALATCTVLVVFISTKFIHGAWIVVVLVPLLVLMFLRIHRHYFDVAQQLSTEGLGPLRPIHHQVIVPISWDYIN